MTFTPYPYSGGYQTYYPQPVPDQLAQLRQNQYQQFAPQPPAAQVPQPATNGVLWVQGEEGAKAYMVAPGNSVMLMDSEGSSFYLKSTDQSGMPLPLRIFDYTERTAAPRTAPAAPQTSGVEYVTQEEFNALVDRLTALENKPCKCADKRKAKEEPENA